MSDVLDDVHDRWKGFTDVQKQQIATAIAGKNQMEIFLALMENYDKALILEQEALNSNGAAMERYAIYQESIAAKMNELKAAFEEFAYSESSQAIIKNFIEVGNAGVRLLNALSPLFQFLSEYWAGIADVFATGVEKVADFIDWIGGESADEKVDKLNGKISDLESQLEAINENPLNLDADTQQSIIKQLNDELERTKELLAQAQGDKVAEERKSSYDGELNTGEKINLDNYLNYYQDLQSEAERANNKISSISKERVSIEEEYQLKLANTQKEIDRISEKLQRAKEANDTWGVDLYTNRLKDLQKQYQNIFKAYEKQKSAINSITAQESANVKSIDDNIKSVVTWAKETYKIITALKDEGVQLSEQEEYFLKMASTMPEILHDFSDFNDKLVENTNNLENNTKATEQNTLAKESSKKSTSDLKAELELLNDTVNDLDNQQKVLNAALEQFQKEGGLSVQTALDLVNANDKFADALMFVDGKIKLNIDSLQNLAQQSKITAAESLASALLMLEGYESVANAMAMVTNPGSGGGNPLWEEQYGYHVLESTANATAVKNLKDKVQAILNYNYGSIGNISNFRPSESGSSSSSSSSSGKTDEEKAYEEALKNKQDLFKTYLDYILKQLDKEKDALEKEKDKWNEYYDEQLKGIEEVSDALDEEAKKEQYLLDIQEKRNNLAKANSEVVRIFRSGKGMVDLCHG